MSLELSRLEIEHKLYKLELEKEHKLQVNDLEFNYTLQKLELEKELKKLELQKELDEKEVKILDIKTTKKVNRQKEYSKLANDDLLIKIWNEHDGLLSLDELIKISHVKRVHVRKFYLRITGRIRNEK